MDSEIFYPLNITISLKYASWVENFNTQPFPSNELHKPGRGETEVMLCCTQDFDLFSTKYRGYGIKW